MKLPESCPTFLFYVLVSSLFFLFATVISAGMSGLCCLVGDWAAGKIFGWIAAGFGLTFFAHFLWLVFLHIVLGLMKDEND